HVTIDNGSTGHAAKAVQSVLDNLPRVGDAQAFYERVMRGYLLNDLGPGSTAVIDSFELEQQVLRMLERKRTVASLVHSDYCRIEGRTVTQWLGNSGDVAGSLEAMQRNGWIKRDKDPAESRFWRLVEGQGAAMFGVFSPYERQLLHDWIAGHWQPAEQRPPFRARRPSKSALPAAGTQHGELHRERPN